jgi:hypothetical protein
MPLFVYRLAAGFGYVRIALLDDYDHLLDFLELPCGSG